MPLFLLALLCSLSAQAALITSAPLDGTTTVVPAGPGCGGGPIGAITISEFTNPVCWPTGQSFGLSDNGNWNNPAGSFGLIGINSATAYFILDLGAAYASVGVFMNYPIPLGNGGPVLSALAADGVTILESYNIHSLAPISTPNAVNAGAFRGIARSSADIRYLQVASGFAAVHSITVAPSATAVPEPGTLFLLAPSLLFLIRRLSC